MKINHTPAPWHEHDTEAFTVCGPDHISLALADTKSRPAVENWANTRLICAATSAPHDCDIPNCPGRENKRKLELFDEMLAAFSSCEAFLKDCIERKKLHPSNRTLARIGSDAEDCLLSIARAKGEK